MGEQSGWIGTVLHDKWTIDAKIARGGVATVFRATHRQGQVAAIKIMHPELSRNEEVRKRFLREGYAANKVGHPGVVRVLDDDVTPGGSAYIVMELLSGGQNLEEKREKSAGKLEVDEVCALCTQILDVLAAAHEKGIIHRDIKPENLFVLDDGVVKVLDFGIAHIKEAAAEESTATGLLLGTPEYMAPEQALGKRGEIDAQTDIYALGATMFTLLSGEAVHPSTNLHALLGAAATRQARTLASTANAKEIPAPLVAVVDRALALEKHRRWPSARAMQDALRKATPEKSGAPRTPRMFDGATERVTPPSSTDPDPIDSDPIDSIEPSTARPAGEVHVVTRRSSGNVSVAPVTAAAISEPPTTRQPDAAPPPRLSRPPVPLARPPMPSRPPMPTRPPPMAARPAMPSRPPPPRAGAKLLTLPSAAALPSVTHGAPETPRTPRMLDGIGAIDPEPPSLPTLVDPPAPPTTLSPTASAPPSFPSRPAPPSAPPPSVPTAVLEKNHPAAAPPATVRLAPIDPEDGPTLTKLPEMIASPAPDTDDFDDVDAEGPTEATLAPPVARPPEPPPRPPMPSDEALMHQKTTAMLTPQSMPPPPPTFPMTPQQPFAPHVPFPSWTPQAFPAPMVPPQPQSLVTSTNPIPVIVFAVVMFVVVLVGALVTWWIYSH